MTRVAEIDAGWVRERMARGLPLSAIARMAGASEIDLRRRFAPTEALVSEMRRRSVASAEAEARMTLSAAGMSEDQARIVARLYAAGDQPITTQEAAAGVIGGTAVAAAVGAARDTAYRRFRLKTHGRATGLWMEDGSRQRLTRMIADWRAREGIEP